MPNEITYDFTDTLNMQKQDEKAHMRMKGCGDMRKVTDIK
jgi:hypothetical protein